MAGCGDAPYKLLHCSYRAQALSPRMISMAALYIIQTKRLLLFFSRALSSMRDQYVSMDKMNAKDRPMTATSRFLICQRTDNGDKPRSIIATHAHRGQDEKSNSAQTNEQVTHPTAPLKPSARPAHKP